MKRVLAIGLLVCSAFPVSARAQITGYGSGDGLIFAFQLESYHENSFGIFNCCYPFPWLTIPTSHGWQYTISANSGDLYSLDSAISTSLAEDRIVIDFEGEAVTAFSGKFGATNSSRNFVPSEIIISMTYKDDGVGKSVQRIWNVPNGTNPWHGFISDFPFHQLTIRVPITTGRYLAMDDFLIGCTNPRPWGDVTGDGFPDIDDTLATLACFGGDCRDCFDERVNTCDITPCGGDGFSDIDDTLATLAAFGGAQECEDPC